MKTMKKKCMTRKDRSSQRNRVKGITKKPVMTIIKGTDEIVSSNQAEEKKISRQSTFNSMLKKIHISKIGASNKNTIKWRRVRTSRIKTNKLRKNPRNNRPISLTAARKIHRLPNSQRKGRQWIFSILCKITMIELPLEYKSKSKTVLYGLVLCSFWIFLLYQSKI